MGKVGEEITGYCMKEKKKVTFKIESATPTAKGTTLNRGKCPDCGTNVCVMSK